MKRLLLNIVFITIAMGVSIGCATTQANDKFEKEIHYTAKFKCIPMDTKMKELESTINADCERYDKKAWFGDLSYKRCKKQYVVTIYVPYQCKAKQEQK